MAEFVIVGGGVYGCAVAWNLAQQGAEVVLLEAKTIASGASGGLGKRGVRANGRDLRELPLMRLAYDIWPTLHETLAGPTGYEQDGHLLLIERQRDYAAAEAHVWMQQQQGISTQLIEAAELRELEPHVSEQIIAAIHCPRDGIADHTATTQSYAQAAGNLGTQIREQTAVVGLERQGERITAVLTDQQERIPVGRTLLLLANNHVSTFLGQHFGLTLPIWSTLPQALLTEPIDPMPLNHLIGHAHRTLAMKTVPGKHIMISGGWRGRWNADLQRGETQPDQVAGNQAEAIAVYPNLAEVGLIKADASRPEAISSDGIPIIDQVPGIRNLIFATGWSGHGWAIAPAVSQLLAEWALSNQKPAHFQPFSYTRFSAL